MERASSQEEKKHEQSELLRNDISKNYVRAATFQTKDSIQVSSYIEPVFVPVEDSEPKSGEAQIQAAQPVASQTAAVQPAIMQLATQPMYNSYRQPNTPQNVPQQMGMTPQVSYNQTGMTPQVPYNQMSMTPQVPYNQTGMTPQVRYNQMQVPYNQLNMTPQVPYNQIGLAPQAQYNQRPFQAAGPIVYNTGGQPNYQNPNQPGH